MISAYLRALFEEILQLRKSLIDVRSQLYLQTAPLLDELESETSKLFQSIYLDINVSDKTQMILHHESFSNNESGVFASVNIIQELYKKYR